MRPNYCYFRTLLSSTLCCAIPSVARHILSRCYMTSIWVELLLQILLFIIRWKYTFIQFKCCYYISNPKGPFQQLKVISAFKDIDLSLCFESQGKRLDFEYLMFQLPDCAIYCMMGKAKLLEWFDRYFLWRHWVWWIRFTKRFHIGYWLWDVQLAFWGL